MAARRRTDPELLAKIAAGKKKLEEHDKKHARDNSVKELVELTSTFYQFDNAVKDIEKRIVAGVVRLAHEVTTKELRLETLVDECNKKKMEKENRKVKVPRVHHHQRQRGMGHHRRSPAD